jgi:type IX secretion system PorP/SprF family membrane protein
MMKKTIYTIAISLLSMSSWAQQEAMNTQYIMNKLFINPAYAGYKEQVSVLAMHRSQWIGFKGAPMTQIISFDMPLKKNEFAMGATVIHDRIGPTSRLGMSVDFAYRAKLTNRATLSFGLKGIIDLYQNDLTSLDLISNYYGDIDPTFMTNTKGLMLPNAGFGVYYYKKDHYIGISIPKLLRPELEKKGTTMYDLLDGRSEPTVHLMAGKIWKVNRQIKVQPNFVFRAVPGAPVSLGLYFNVIMMDQFTFGAFSHIGENAGLLAQWQVDKRIKLGYAVDVPTNTLIRTNLGSHEVIASYAIATKRKRIVYPRYF